MSFLRSSLFVTIVSLFVLTCYGFDLFDDCCSRQEQGQAGHGKSSPNDRAPGSGNGCQCICHQVITPLTAEPVQLAGAVFVQTDFVAHLDEFPPDAVPVGIEVPPQLV
ncbi:MAG: hypothetical protein WDN28_30800 [Chthoniobacter sp.]